MGCNDGCETAPASAEGSVSIQQPPQPQELPNSTETMDDKLEYDPEVMARYVHFYETGQDINDPDSKNAPLEQPPKKKRKKKHVPPIVLETRRTIQLCCRDSNLLLALQTFHRALRDLVRVEAQTFYQLLNLCEGSFAERTGVHVGTPKFFKKADGGNGAEGKNEKEDTKPAVKATSISLKQRLHHAHRIHSLLSSLNIPPIEQAYTALIRLSSRAGDFEGAEKYLDEAEETQQCKVKLRMYSCLLRAYCGELSSNNEEDVNVNDIEAADAPTTQGQLIQALKVWKRMYDNSGGLSADHPNYSNAIKEGNGTVKLFGEGIAPKISLTECEYSALMTCATKLHDIPVMERIFSDVADQVLVPGSKTTDIMLNWFRADVGKSGNVSTALDHVTLPPREGTSLTTMTNENGKGWDIYRSCTVESATGKLTLSGPEYKNDNAIANSDANYSLKPVELTNRAWKAMRDMNSSIVLEGEVEGNVSKFQGGGKGKKHAREGNNGNNKNNSRHNQNYNSKNPHWRIDSWKMFETFIQEHSPYNIVIDGANVGYYEQNFNGSPKHVDYNQIDCLLRHLLEQSSSNDQHHIILFLHERHFSPKLAPSWAYPMFKSWDGNAPPYNRLSVYRTPAGMNDDWFWMHAALENGEKEGTPSVLAVTNDEMRDHHFQMSAQGSFLRWKERHQVHFDFGSYNKNLNRRDVLLQYPNSYSRRIQRVDSNGAEGGEAIAIPLPKKGDEGRFADGLHVAEEGVPDEETYVVIRKVI